MAIACGRSVNKTAIACGTRVNFKFQRTLVTNLLDFNCQHQQLLILETLNLHSTMRRGFSNHEYSFYTKTILRTIGAWLLVPSL